MRMVVTLSLYGIYTCIRTPVWVGLYMAACMGVYVDTPI